MTYVPAVFVIWLALPAFMLTMASFSTDIVNGFCVPYGVHMKKAVLLMVILVGYLLPLALMIFCYSHIVYKLRIKVKRSTGWAKKVSQPIFAITLSANFHYFWHIYTIRNLHLEDVYRRTKIHHYESTYLETW